jgi:hypothetical protein
MRYFLSIAMGAVLIAGTCLFLTATKTSAQCGSQASSCKNCHETQSADPVNNDGTTWHTQHAQIDACVSCHAGNPQSTDKVQSHTGMVAWDSDIKAGCASCHPDNYTQLAQAYATTLGITLSAGGTTPVTAATPEATAVNTATLPTAPTGGGIVVSQPGTIDYTQQYQETVLGLHPINWGNVIVGVMLAAFIVGGGAYIYWNERKLRGLSGFFTIKAAAPVEGIVPVVEGYSTQVTALLPLIAKLNPVGLHALQRILANPEQANENLHSLAHLDPDLVKRVQALDKDTRALLLALAGS